MGRPIRSGYAPTLSTEAGIRLSAILGAFADFHGTTARAVADQVIGARNLPQEINLGLTGQRPPRSFTTGTYDKFVGYLSWLWPVGLEWPEGIPRPEPLELPPDRAGAALERFPTRARPTRREY